MNDMPMNLSAATLADEQKSLQLDYFDYQFSWQLGCALRTEAESRALPISITIAHGSDLVFSILMPGATSDNLAWAARKRAVAHRFHKSSLAIKIEAAEKGYDFNQMFRVPREEFVASGGAFPLILRGGTLIGTVAVSGMPDIEDHAIVVRGLRQVLGVGA